MYKLQYFQKFDRKEILRIKNLKKYIKSNKKIKNFFIIIKKKFYSKLVFIKKNIIKHINEKKQKQVIFNLYKKYIFFNKLRFLFTKKKNKAKAYSMRSFSLLQKKRYNEHTKTNKAFIFLSSLQKPKSSVPSKGYVLVSFKGYKEYKEYKKCIPSSKVVRWFLHNFGLT